MQISKGRVALNKGSPAKKEQKKEQAPTLDTFLKSRDYVGAITLLEFYQRTLGSDRKSCEWLAYCHFHFGEHDKALQVYQQLQADEDEAIFHTYIGACYYYLGMYKEAREAALKGPENSLQLRILFSLAQKTGDENALMDLHSQMGEGLENQLCLAACHYRRNHHQEATDIYKKILIEHREYLALNVYIALCYSKLDYYDVSQEILQVYLTRHPHSPLALNLKACNQFRLYNGAVAEQELKPLRMEGAGGNSPADWADQPLIKHNLTVFKSGVGSPQVLPPLVDVLPEARLNLAVYHLKNGSVQAAFELIKDVKPQTPQDYIIHAVTNLIMVQEEPGQAPPDGRSTAQQYFQMVGSSQSECDTIPGRQCMATFFLLMKQFDDALIFLRSIWQYFTGDDDFQWNMGVALIGVGQWEEAEEVLLGIRSQAYREDFTYLHNLAMAYIHNGKPRSAYELYLRREASEESYQLLQLIANECYTEQHYLYAAKAFDQLERIDPNPEFWEGKRGACSGTLHAIIAGDEPKESLNAIISMLQDSSNQQAIGLVSILQQWGHDNGVPLHI